MIFRKRRYELEIMKHKIDELELTLYDLKLHSRINSMERKLEDIQEYLKMKNKKGKKNVK